MPLPVHRREFDVFLSHAHADVGFIVRLRSALEQAGLAVFLDQSEIAGGADFTTSIQGGIERSRSALVVATDASLESGWVRHEIAVALDERARDPDFRVIPLRVGDADVDRVIRGISWLQIAEPVLDRNLMFEILRSFYPTENRPDPRRSRDVYVSASWRDRDSASSVAVCRYLCDQGFRLVGDSKDQDGFGEDRIDQIVASCGALVCVLPFRDGESTASADARPYKYFLREIDLAARHGLPTVVVADERVRRADGDDTRWIRFDPAADGLPGDVTGSLDDLWFEWREPPRPHRVFMAMDLDSDVALGSSPERQLVETVTGLSTVIGTDIETNPVQHGIIDELVHARLVIADLSGEGETDFNLDSSIEAGMALASGANVRLMARGITRRPPFMLRGLQMPTYADEVERLALVHRIARSYRRRILNVEVGGSAGIR